MKKEIVSLLDKLRSDERVLEVSDRILEGLGVMARFSYNRVLRYTPGELITRGLERFSGQIYGAERVLISCGYMATLALCGIMGYCLYNRGYMPKGVVLGTICGTLGTLVSQSARGEKKLKVNNCTT